MTRPRFLLFGKHGQVAWELRRTLAPLADVTAVGRDDVDLTHADAIRRVIREVAPSFIINAAAYTAVDKAENEEDRARQINAEAPAVMAAEAERHAAALIHFSTDYVFDGTSNTPYVEDDATNPLGAYGRTKLAGEQAVAGSGAPHLILRLCWVYGTRGANFMRTIQRLAREREVLRVVNDQFGCPTPARLIAEATALLLRGCGTPAAVASVSGIYHLCTTGQATWHALASAIVNALPAEARTCRAVEPITTAEYPTPARRPPFTVLATDKLEHSFGLRLPDWRTALDLVLET